MVKANFENIISDYKIGLQTLKDIFNDLSGQYFSKTTTYTILNNTAVEVPVDQKDKKEKIRKVGYMVIAVLCANWEGLHSKLKEDPTAYLNVCDDKFNKWCIQDIQQIGNIRDCIMHHNGDVKSYYKETLIRYRLKNSDSINDRFELKKIDDKFHDKTVRDNEIIVMLSTSDINNFISIMEKDGPEYLGDKILFS